jgi:hypothetical protein
VGLLDVANIDRPVSSVVLSYPQYHYHSGSPAFGQYQILGSATRPGLVIGCQASSIHSGLPLKVVLISTPLPGLDDLYNCEKPGI